MYVIFNDSQTNIRNIRKQTHKNIPPHVTKSIMVPAFVDWNYRRQTIAILEY